MSITSDQIIENGFIHALADDAADEIEILEQRIAALESANAKQAARISELEDERENLEKVEPAAWLYHLEYEKNCLGYEHDRIIADTKVSLHKLNYPFGVCGADYRQGGSYVRQTKLYARPVPARTLTDGWQPIETAPKDGTRIILCGFRDYATVIGFWNDYHAPGHWCFSAETVLRNTDAPTHWMPLPAAPEVK